VGNLHVPGRFAPENEPNYPLNKSQGGTQSRSGHFAEKKMPLARLVLEDRLAQRVA